MLVAAFVLTAGVAVTALNIAAPAAQAVACAGEKDTRSCPSPRLCRLHIEGGRTISECQG